MSPRRLPTILLTALAILLPGAIAQQPQQTRTAAWTCAPAGAIEWVALVGPAQRPCLLVATRTAQIQLIDLGAAQPAPTEPLRVAPGVQCAPRTASAPADVAHCFDRYAVYAIDVAAGTLRWRSGDVPADPTAFRDDPEALTGWLAAVAVPAGVLAVNRDGRVCLLAHTDGHRLWELSLEPLTLARLHALDDRAVVLWKSGAGAKAAFVPLTAERPTPQVRAAGDVWPLWSTLYAGGLLTVMPLGATVLSAAQPPRRIALEALGLSAGTVAVFIPPAQPAPPCGPLLLVGDETRPLAVDLSTGVRRWPASDVRGSGFDIETLRVDDGQVVLTYDVGVYACDVVDGRRTAYIVDASQDFIAAAVAHGQLRAVHRERDVPAAPFKLTTVARTAPDAPAAAPPAAQVCALGSFPAVRQLLWTDRLLLVIESDAVRAFALDDDRHSN